MVTLGGKFEGEVPDKALMKKDLNSREKMRIPKVAVKVEEGCSRVGSQTVNGGNASSQISGPLSWISVEDHVVADRTQVFPMVKEVMHGVLLEGITDSAHPWSCGNRMERFGSSYSQTGTQVVG